jgi:hypothetical protein
MANSEKLRLDFLSTPRTSVENEVSILEEYANQINEYASAYFNTVVTTVSADGNTLSCSLYVLVPEIGFDYRVVTVERAVTRGSITFFTLISDQTERFPINFAEGYQLYKQKLAEILSHPLFNASLKFLVDRVEIKRESRAEV